MKIHLCTAVALAGSHLFLASCSPSNPEEAGYAAMQAGDHAKAADLLKKALSSAEAGGEKAHQLAVARCQALAHVNPVTCQQAFLALESQEIALVQRDYELVAAELLGVTAYEQAAHVVGAGIAQFPDSQRLPEFMDKLKTLAKSGNAPGLQSTLTGLGYGGE